MHPQNLLGLQRVSENAQFGGRLKLCGIRSKAIHTTLSMSRTMRSLLLTFLLLTIVNIVKSSGLHWSWIGALQSNSVRIKTKYSLPTQEDHATVEPQLYLFRRGRKEFSSGSSEEEVGPLQANYRYNVGSNNSNHAAVADFWVDGLLTSNAEYEYEVVLRFGASEWTLGGRFSTPGLEGEAMNFTFAFASCARTGSNSQVFARIASHQPLLFVHMGDLHYGNIVVNSTDVYHGLYDTVFSR